MPLLTAAPMEGLTGAPFRRVHRAFFPGADAYYIPFVSPTREPRFTERQLRELAREVNTGIPVVPQLLTRNADDFLWAAKALADMGYPEVNLNLGCPAGTVVAKGKGAGFLREPAELERFLSKIFSADLPVAVSVKTRIGWSDEREFALLADVYSHFPAKVLIVHPRLKTDQYRGEVRRAVFDGLYESFPHPLGYNGDVTTAADVESVRGRYPKLQQIMVGRALIADPALFRKARGGAAATLEELTAYHGALFESYVSDFGSLKNALMRMKEYWFYWQALFDCDARLVKAVYKAKSLEEYREAEQAIYGTPLLTDARAVWAKPL